MKIHVHSPNLAAATRILFLSCLLIALVTTNGLAEQEREGRNRDLAIKQDPNSVIIQPNTSADKPATSIVQLVVDKNRVRPGETVTFTLGPACIILDPNYSVTIDFGDGTSAVVSQTQIVHTYQRAGQYEPRVSVVLGQRVSGDYEDNSSTQSSLTPPRVSLSAASTPAVTGRPVIFSAQTTSNYPNIRYRFVFGDGSSTDWQEHPQASHTYSKANTYLPYVDIGVLNNGLVKPLGGSLRQRIEVKLPAPQLGATSSSKEISIGRATPAGASANPSSSTTSKAKADSSPITSVGSTTEKDSTSRPPAVPTQTRTSHNGTSSVQTNVASPGLVAPGGDWWKYLLIAALLLLAGYQVFNLAAVPRAIRS